MKSIHLTQFKYIDMKLTQHITDKKVAQQRKILLAKNKFGVIIEVTNLYYEHFCDRPLPT